MAPRAAGLASGQAFERKRKRTANDNSALANLPAEILMDITSKLPISTIFQLLCKYTEFKPLIFNPYFNNIFQSYHNHNSYTSRPPCTLLGSYGDNETFLIEYRPNDKMIGTTSYTKMSKTVRMYDLDMSFLDANDHHKAVSTREMCSTCNGWILVRSFHEFDDGSGLFESLRVVNPATRHCLVFHREPVDDLHNLYTQDNYALGYSSKTGKYKAVKVFLSRNSDWSFEVFDILGQEKRWKKLDFHYQGYTPSCPVLLNGALHWQSSSNTILRFDIDKEEFELIPTPYSDNIDMSLLFLVASCGSLYIGAYKMMDCTQGLEIWRMKEYGVKDTWVRVSVIHEFYPGDYKELFQVLDNNGKMVFISHHGAKELQLYDVETGVRESLVMRGIRVAKRARMRILPFVPSFLSLDGKAHKFSNVK